MRVICGIWSVLLLLFAFVQYNDPDFYFWGTIYAAAAAICALAAFKPAVFHTPAMFWSLTFFVLASLVGIFWFWPQTPGWWKQEVWWETETAREGMGMMIVFICLASAWLVARKQTRNP